MAESLPPSLYWHVSGYLPGVYQWFFDRVAWAHRGTSARPTWTSWYRDPRHNRLVGGSDESQHLVGLALDAVYASDAVAVHVAEQGRAAGLVVVHYPGEQRLHFQALPAGVLRSYGVLDSLGL